MTTDRTGRTNRREILGIFGGIGLNLNSTIGIGIFTAPGVVWKTLNSPLAALILWTIGGLITMAASFSYAEIGATVRQSGGEIGYFWYLGNRYFGKRTSKFIIFVSYIISFLIIIIVIPGETSTQLQATAKYIVYTVSNNPSELKSNVGQREGWSTLRLNLIAISTLVIITGYHIPSSRVANIINQTIAGMKLVILFIIAIVGLVKLPSVLKERSNIWSNPGFDDTKGFGDIISAYMLVMFSYNGWNTLNYVLDEFKDPRRNLIISNITSAIIVTTLYLLVNIAFITVVPKELILDDKDIVTHFFEELLGEKGGQISSFIVTLSSTGIISSLVFLGSRIIAYAAQQDYIPFFSDDLKWESRDKSPKNALIVQFVWCSLLIILVNDGISSNFYGSFTSFYWYTGLAIYVLTGIVLLLLRLNRNTDLFRYYKKDYNILILLFIAEKIYGFMLSSYDATCPENVSNCEEYLKNERIKKQAPYFTSAIFMAIGIICYFVIYRILRKKKVKKDDDSSDDYGDDDYDDHDDHNDHDDYDDYDDDDDDDDDNDDNDYRTEKKVN